MIPAELIELPKGKDVSFLAVYTGIVGRV